VGAPLHKTPFSALYLPVLAPEFTESGQEEAGKGLKILFCGGSSLHATPFRQEAAVNWMPMYYFLLCSFAPLLFAAEQRFVPSLAAERRGEGNSLPLSRRDGGRAGDGGPIFRLSLPPLASSPRNGAKGRPCGSWASCASAHSLRA
jgi:hypothetical protein